MPHLTVETWIWITAASVVIGCGSLLRFAQWYFDSPRGEEIELNYGSYTKWPPHDETPF